MKEKIILIGAKGGAKMCIDILNSTNEYELVGLIDSVLPKGQFFHGSIILGNNLDLQNHLVAGVRSIAIAFTSKHALEVRRELILNFETMGFNFPNLIHKNADIEPSVKMGKGNILTNKSYIGSDVQIGDFNFFNPQVTICHDVKIGDSNHFSSGSVVSGYSTIKNNSLVGVNTIIGDNYFAEDNFVFEDFKLYTK